MHQSVQRLGLYQGPSATPGFGLDRSSRRQCKQAHSSQLIVSGNIAQGQMHKLHKQHRAPNQGLPAEERKPALPATSVQPKAAKPEVSASDRTLNVIVRVCKTSDTLTHAHEDATSGFYAVSSLCQLAASVVFSQAAEQIYISSGMLLNLAQ